MSNFAFLLPEWPTLHAEAVRAEELAQSDPRGACFYARRGLELSVKWLYAYESSLGTPYDNSLSALIHAPSFQQLAGEKVFAKARLIKDLGNLAAHSTRQLSAQDGVAAVRELFHFAYWQARTYGRKHKPGDGLRFDAALLPAPSGAAPITPAQMGQLAAELAQKDAQLDALLTGQAELDIEIKQLRAEVAAAKQANAGIPDTHDYSEAQTRDYFIDLLLKEAGWALDTPDRDTEYPVTGMPNDKGEGFVDYVCWGADGKPLALVEAKRTRHDSRIGQQQARLYADCLEQMHGQRPVIYYSNGYEHWLWDDRLYPPRRVSGFHKPGELELLIQRRSTRKPLGEARIDPQIVERPYQTRAIRRIGESFERDHMRKALVVMATGAGKTRTVIALCDLLKRCNWVKRVLFLADRDALVNQALKAFKQHDPASSPVDLRKEKNSDSRTCLSTYQTMMGLIDDSDGPLRKFGIGHFDLVIIDEAHRSVYQKYGAIFDYFDSLLVGLTATPKDQVDHNTYKLFDLEDGVPTDAYTLEEAVADGYLVPPRAVSAPLGFPTEGLTYDAMPEDEKERWDALEWAEDGEVPERVEREAVHNWFFSSSTADLGLEYLMREGLKVESGDKLGKTVIFAKSTAHADFLADRFNINFPYYKGEFARVITFKTKYAQSLIDDFSDPKKLPQVAISVDMLDTGIDVPQVVNLVYFKQVRSKTKFWQMLGRGTRLSPGLFGPGQDKECFYIFDYCRNLEYFKEDPAQASGRPQESLSKRLFINRLELLRELGETGSADEEQELGGELREQLNAEVAGMSLDNFIVRPQRKLVEEFSDSARWETLSGDDYHALAGSVAGLPSAVAAEDTDEEAKRFDLFMLRLQLKLLQADPGYLKQRDKLIKLAQMLSDLVGSIPAVREQAILLDELQSADWWIDVTAPMLDNARKRLRKLVALLDFVTRMPVYTSFADSMGEATLVELPGLNSGVDEQRYRAKVRQFLRSQLEHPVIHKVRWMEPLTGADLATLERLLVESGVARAEDIERAARDSAGLAPFIRSLVGLDREAAKRAFAGFLADKTLTSGQLEFINLIIDQLTEFGAMQPVQLYGSPYTDISPMGPEGIFTGEQLETIVSTLQTANGHATT